MITAYSVMARRPWPRLWSCARGGVDLPAGGCRLGAERSGGRGAERGGARVRETAAVSISSAAGKVYRDIRRRATTAACTTTLLSYIVRARAKRFAFKRVPARRHGHRFGYVRARARGTIFRIAPIFFIPFSVRCGHSFPANDRVFAGPITLIGGYRPDFHERRRSAAEKARRKNRTWPTSKHRSVELP